MNLLKIKNFFSNMPMVASCLGYTHIEFIKEQTFIKGLPKNAMLITDDHLLVDLLIKHCIDTYFAEVTSPAFIIDTFILVHTLKSTKDMNLYFAQVFLLFFANSETEVETVFFDIFAVNEIFSNDGADLICNYKSSDLADYNKFAKTISLDIYTCFFMPFFSVLLDFCRIEFKGEDVLARSCNNDFFTYFFSKLEF